MSSGRRRLRTGPGGKTLHAFERLPDAQDGALGDLCITYDQGVVYEYGPKTTFGWGPGRRLEWGRVTQRSFRCAMAAMQAAWVLEGGGGPSNSDG